MKLTAFKGQVVSLGRPRASDRHTKDNVVLDSEDGETFYLTLSPEKLSELHIGQTIVVSFETEDPAEAPADITAKSMPAARHNVMLNRTLRSIEAQGVEWDVSVTVDGPRLPARFIVTRPNGKRVVFVPEGGPRAKSFNQLFLEAENRERCAIALAEELFETGRLDEEGLQSLRSALGVNHG